MRYTAARHTYLRKHCAYKADHKNMPVSKSFIIHLWSCVTWGDYYNITDAEKPFQASGIPNKP